jgi:hypothetical protein
VQPLYPTKWGSMDILQALSVPTTCFTEALLHPKYMSPKRSSCDSRCTCAAASEGLAAAAAVSCHSYDSSPVKVLLQPIEAFKLYRVTHLVSIG